jgi:hypothetical protein
MSKVINFLLDAVGAPSDVIVLGSDDSANLRKASWYERLIYFIPSSKKFFVYNRGLARGVSIVVSLGNKLLKEKPNSPEYEKLFTKATALRTCLEKTENLHPTKVSKNTSERIHNLASSLLTIRKSIIQQKTELLNMIKQTLQLDHLQGLEDSEISSRLLQKIENSNQKISIVCVNTFKHKFHGSVARLTRSFDLTPWDYNTGKEKCSPGSLYAAARYVFGSKSEVDKKEFKKPITILVDNNFHNIDIVEKVYND